MSSSDSDKDKDAGEKGDQIDIQMADENDEDFFKRQEEIYGDPKTEFPCGAISLQLDKCFYEPGDTLTGMMYIQVREAFKCKKIMLDVETEEKVEFTRFWVTHSHYTDAEGNQRTKTHHHNERVEDKHDGFEFKSKLLDLKQYNKQFEVGNYAIQFQFKLPDVLPSSLKFKNHHDKAKPEAKVVHEIKVKLKGTDFEDSPDFKVEFKVRNDKSRVTGKELSVTKTQELVNYFCYAKGDLKMGAEFEKEFFYKDDSPDCKVVCDLSNGDLPIPSIDYEIMQYTLLKVGKFKWRGTKLLIESKY